MQPETAFKNRIRPKLEALPNIWIEKIQQMTIHGTPDFLMCVAGYFIALELKKDERSKPTKLQIYKLKKIYEAGGAGLIISPKNWESTYDRIKRVANRQKSSFSDLRAISRAGLYGSSSETE